MTHNDKAHMPRERTLTIKEVYKRFMHLDELIMPDGYNLEEEYCRLLKCADELSGSPNYNLEHDFKLFLLRTLWVAVKEAARLSD